MNPTQRGAFCNKCVKEVIDCTKINTETIQSILSTQKNTPCVRINKIQLEELNFIHWYSNFSLAKQLKLLFLFSFFFVQTINAFASSYQTSSKDSTRIQPQFVELDSIDQETIIEFIENMNYQPTEDLYSVKTPIPKPQLIKPYIDTIIWQTMMGDIAYEPFLGMVTEKPIATSNPLFYSETAPIELKATNYMLVGKNKYTFFIEDNELIFNTNCLETEYVKIKVKQISTNKVVFSTDILLLKGQKEIHFSLREYDSGLYQIIMEGKAQTKGIELKYTKNTYPI